MTHRLLAILAWSVLGAASLPAAQTPVAESAAQPPATVTFSLSSDSVVQYEPVVLYYRISSGLCTQLEIAFGSQDHTAWLGLQCFGPDGSRPPRVKAVDLPRSLFSTGAGIAPSSKHDEAVVVQRIYDTSAPGRYEVHLSPRLRWAAKDGSAAGTIAFTQRLSFEVMPANPKRLAHVMDSLVARALGPMEDYTARTTAIQALFSIPEAEALLTWDMLLEQAITQGQDTVVRLAVDEMVRVPTAAKADLLAEVVWGRYRDRLDLASPNIESPGHGVLIINPSPLILAAASGGLYNMYWAGDSKLKEHIRDLFITNEGAMPEIKNPVVPLQ